MSPLVDQAEALERRLWVALDACYVDHPHLDRIPAPDVPRGRIRKLKRLIDRAHRRVNRRKHAAGIYIPIAGAMWMVNQADAGYF